MVASPSANLANIRLDEFSGGADVSARAYRMWKKSVFAKARLHKLTDSELALVIYTEVEGQGEGVAGNPGNLRLGAP